MKLKIEPPYGCTFGRSRDPGHPCERDADFCCQDCGEARCIVHRDLPLVHADDCKWKAATTQHELLVMWNTQVTPEMLKNEKQSAEQNRPLFAK